jgi:hypothetical protein
MHTMNLGIDQVLLSAGGKMHTTSALSASKPSYQLKDNFIWSEISPEKILSISPY